MTRGPCKSTLNTVNNLGNLYANQGKVHRAEEMDLRAHEKDTLLQSILSTLPCATSERSRVEFKIQWDPISYIREQEYNLSPAEAIKFALTLTGSEVDAQALSATDYLTQTWPLSGGHIMNLLSNVINVYPDRANSRKQTLSRIN